MKLARFFFLLAALLMFAIAGLAAFDVFSTDRNTKVENKESGMTVGEKQIYQNQLSIANPFKTIELTESEKRWRLSLVKNLGHEGQILTYALTDLDVLKKEEKVEHVVFQNTDRPRQFLVKLARRVIVDFEQREVGTGGVGGITFHSHPNGKMIVCLIPTPVNVIGVPLSDTAKTGGEIPHFEGTSVQWSW